MPAPQRPARDEPGRDEEVEGFQQSGPSVRRHSEQPFDEIHSALLSDARGCAGVVEVEPLVSFSASNVESNQKNDDPTQVPHVFTALLNSL